MGIINVPDISPRDDDFTQLAFTRPVDWICLSGLPANRLEEKVRGVRISRYRAATQAALAARNGRVVVSHLPLMSAATASAMKLLHRRVPHLAFSFNFTDRPSGLKLEYMRRALSTVDQFAVYSNYERPLYAALFGIDPARFSPVIWTQSVPPTGSVETVDDGRPYFCAIGGEGRDIGLIFETARRLPKALRVVLIARPHNVAGFSVPDNVEILTNIPLDQTWALAKASLGVLVPLRSEDTCCGHITLVSAKQLGIPIAATRSFATREYVEGRDGIIECEPAEPTAYAALLERLIDDQETIKRAARDAASGEIAFHDRSKWAQYVSLFLESLN